jgi:hypothetical protein
MVGAIHIWRDGQAQLLEPDGDLAQTLRAASVRADDLIRHDGQWMHAGALVSDLPAIDPPAIRTPWLLVLVMVAALAVIVAGVIISWPTAGPPPAAPSWQPPTPIPMPAQAPPKPLAALQPRACAGLPAACVLQAKHPDWSLPVCTAIIESRVMLGMRRAQVLQSWGKPIREDGPRWCYEADCATGVRWQSDRVVEVFGP